MSTSHGFPGTYAEARQHFLAAAASGRLELTTLTHPLLGREGETLALDATLEGSREAPALLVISSGCHGIEGHAGSAVQLALLSDTAWHQAVREAGIAVLYMHALNPHGYSWGRRVTQENVDLNRNFLAFDHPLPPKPAYDDLAGWLVPPRWPPGESIEQALAEAVASRGQRVLQHAISQGQHAHPEGLFFSGRNPTWSHLAVRRVLREHGRTCQRLVWLDLHTGLGPTGAATPIAESRADDMPGALARARAWWGPQVTAADDDAAVSTPVCGSMLPALFEQASQAECTGLTLEFGTEPPLQVLTALRAEQWLENHPETETGLALEIRRQFQAAFCPESPAWRRGVIDQGVDAAWRALAGLRG